MKYICYWSWAEINMHILWCNVLIVCQFAMLNFPRVMQVGHLTRFSPPKLKLPTKGCSTHSTYPLQTSFDFTVSFRALSSKIVLWLGMCTFYFFYDTIQYRYWQNDTDTIRYQSNQTIKKFTFFHLVFWYIHHTVLYYSGTIIF